MTSKAVYFRSHNSQSSDQELAEDVTLHEQVIAAIRTVYDPEIPVNLYDLGLIYDISIDDEQQVSIKMTLTAPGCPVAGILPKQVENAIAAIEQVNDVNVEIVWDPPWSQDRMTEEARLELGML